MNEDSISSDPAPPDIRPGRRIASYNHHHPSSDGIAIGLIVRARNRNSGLNQATEHCRRCSNTRKSDYARHGIKLHLSSTFLVAIALAFATTASASPLSPSMIDDPFTSGPDTIYAWGKAPIISSLCWVGTRLLAVASGWAGYDLVPSAAFGSGSGVSVGLGGMTRRNDLSTGEIVEACMIPVLVALSGMFAGLTLG
jgi:hypothetical protein